MNARPPRESLRYQHRRRSDDDGVVKRAVGHYPGVSNTALTRLVTHSSLYLSLMDDSRKEDDSEEEKRLEQRNA